VDRAGARTAGACLTGTRLDRSGWLEGKA